MNKNRERHQRGAVDSAARVFLGELIDDAGLFPPAQLGMRDALDAHERAEASPQYWMLGRFVVLGSRLGELVEALDDAPDPLPLSVIVDGELRAGVALAAEFSRGYADRIIVEAIEAKTEPDALGAAVREARFDDPPAQYVEVAVDDYATLEAYVSTLARRREGGAVDVAAKVRCGGSNAGAVPSPEALAKFIALTRRHAVPFKATAGLHHPLRHWNAAAGSTMHGFLNVVGAAILAHANPSLDEGSIVEMIADEDAEHFVLDAARFAWRGHSAGPAEIGAARVRAIHSYGSCSFAEPVDALLALGMLEPATSA